MNEEMGKDVYKDRIDRVYNKMKDADLKQLLINDSLSIYYLTGIMVHPLERFWALLLRTDGENVIFANKLYGLSDTGFKTVTMDDTDDVAQTVVPWLLDDVLGVDKDLPARFLLPIIGKSGLSAVNGSDCVDDVRAVKDETEKEIMRRASKINDICIEKVASYIHDGATEKECSDFLHQCYLDCGAQGEAFTSIISFGANAADPHHNPDDTVIKEGDCIVIDIGCKVDGYCSDMTRTYFWKTADPEYAAIYELVRNANEKAEALVRSGVRLCDIDAAARNVISEAGYGEYFTHRLGHFIGMEDHEKGDVSSANQNTAEEGMIFSIEPGVYLPGRFGARVEDLVIVTEDGCEILNKVGKDLRVLS